MAPGCPVFSWPPSLANSSSSTWIAPLMRSRELFRFACWCSVSQGFLAGFEFEAEFFETLFELVFYYVLAFY
jgi:hypothetical protein